MASDQKTHPSSTEPTVVADSVARAGPNPADENVLERLRESFNRARYNGNTRPQTVKIFINTFIDRSIEHWRSVLSPDQKTPSIITREQKSVLPEVRVAPNPADDNIFGRLRESFNRARYNGNTPLQAVDIFTKTLVDTSLAHWRGILFSDSIDKGVTTMPASLLKPLAYIASGDWSRPGDRQFSESLATKTDAYFDGQGAKPQKFGEYDIAMAAGWHPKGKVIYNGVETVLTKPIENLYAVFVRNPDGRIEIIDPSIQATSLSQAALLFPSLPALLTATGTPSDKKWSQTAGGYIASQLLPMIATSGFGALLKSGAALSQASTVSELANGVAKVEGLGKAFTAAQMGSMGLNLAGMKYQASVSNATADNLVSRIVDALKDPTKITPSIIVDALNKGLHQYTFNASTSNSIYIPSLSDKDSPWARLQQVLVGRLDGKVKDNSPWDTWKSASKIAIPDIRDKLVGNPQFMSTYLALSQKCITGQKLSDGEVFALRVGMGAINDFKYELAGSESSSTRIKYTEQEMQMTRKDAHKALEELLVSQLDTQPEVAALLGVDLKKYSDLSYKLDTRVRLKEQGVPTEALQLFIQKSQSGIQASIEQERRAIATAAQGQVMAFTMH